MLHKKIIIINGYFILCACACQKDWNLYFHLVFLLHLCSLNCFQTKKLNHLDRFHVHEKKVKYLWFYINLSHQISLFWKIKIYNRKCLKVRLICERFKAKWDYCIGLSDIHEISFKKDIKFQEHKLQKIKHWMCMQNVLKFIFLLKQVQLKSKVFSSQKSQDTCCEIF